jgi:hypothetical protein
MICVPRESNGLITITYLHPKNLDVEILDVRYLDVKRFFGRME